jgi:RNA recognition motif-containing protein
MSQSQTTIFVSNLAYTLDTQDLYTAFSGYGKITDAKIIKDRESGRSKGFGFVTFQSEEEAKASLIMNGRDLSGREIRVNFARKQTQRTDTETQF